MCGNSQVVRIVSYWWSKHGDISWRLCGYLTGGTVRNQNCPTSRHSVPMNISSVMAIRFLAVKFAHSRNSILLFTRCSGHLTVSLIAPVFYRVCGRNCFLLGLWKCAQILAKMLAVLLQLCVPNMLNSRRNFQVKWYMYVCMYIYLFLFA
jgi:hypothetical protein